MEIRSLDEFKNGWFWGDFEPSIRKDKVVEIGLHEYKKGHRSDGHYHELATEVNVIIKGKVWVDTEVLNAGMIWIVEPNEILETEFLEDTQLIVIKSPSIPGDKYWLKPVSKELEEDNRNWKPCPEDEELLFKAVN